MSGLEILIPGVILQPASSNGIEVLRILHASRDAAEHLSDDATHEE